MLAGYRRDRAVLVGLDGVVEAERDDRARHLQLAHQARRRAPQIVRRERLQPEQLADTDALLAAIVVAAQRARHRLAGERRVAEAPDEHPRVIAHGFRRDLDRQIGQRLR